MDATAGGTVGDFRFALNEATGRQCAVFGAHRHPLKASTGDEIAGHPCRDDASLFHCDLAGNEFELKQAQACNDSSTQVTLPIDIILGRDREDMLTRLPRAVPGILLVITRRRCPSHLAVTYERRI